MISLINVQPTYVEFAKIDDDRQLVFGWAYVAKDADGNVRVDTDDDFIDDDDELEKAAYEFLKSSRRGHAMHAKQDVANLVESIVFTKEKQERMGIPSGVLPELAWWVGYHVHDPETWNLVKEKKLRGFSMGGKGMREKVQANA